MVYRQGMRGTNIPVSEQLPYAVLLDVLVLVEPALPPLDVAAWVCLVDRVVSPGLHESAHAAPGVCARGVNVHDVLTHNMVKEEPVDGPVAPFDEDVLEAALIQPLHTFFPPVARAEKLDVRVRVVGEHVDNFVVEALVEIVTILEMGLAHF